MEASLAHVRRRRCRPALLGLMLTSVALVSLTACAEDQHEVGRKCVKPAGAVLCLIETDPGTHVIFEADGLEPRSTITLRGGGFGGEVKSFVAGTDGHLSAIGVDPGSDATKATLIVSGVGSTGDSFDKRIRLELDVDTATTTEAG